jgi:DNA-binding NarL/FixJ family response regulator
MLAATGMSSKDIADRLYLSVRTVNNHLQHADTKLGVSSSPRSAGGEGFPTLVEYVYSADESLTSWAIAGLEKLDVRAARQELWRARSNRAID